VYLNSLFNFFYVDYKDFLAFFQDMVQHKVNNLLIQELDGHFGESFDIINPRGQKTKKMFIPTNLKISQSSTTI